MKRKFVLYAIVLAAVAGTAAWLGVPEFARSARRPNPAQAAPRAVPTALVKALPLMQTRDFPGKVRASQRVQLAFSVPGLLEELNALEGREVRKGEVIARLDQRDYSNAVDVARATHTDARQTFERARSLLNRRVVPEAELDHAKAALDTAAANLRIREKALADTVLTAPFDGIVATRYVENHEHIQAKQPVLSIQNASIVEIVVQAPERLVARGSAEAVRRIAVRFDADSERWFDAAIQEHSAQADPVTRTYEFVAGMKPPTDIRVLPGMTATVRVEMPRHPPIENWTEGATLIPACALVNAPRGESYVWLVDGKPGPPRKVIVTVGEPRDGGIEIRSGLRPGQRIATAGVHTLADSQLVRPMRARGAGLAG